MVLLCPRRVENSGVFKYPVEDSWQQFDGQFSHCSYCGSMNPEELLKMLRIGECSLGPTDKNYKVYIEYNKTRETKFYFQHFSEVQKQEFVELFNQKTFKICYPGYFYVLPFFMEYERGLDE